MNLLTIVHVRWRKKELLHQVCYPASPQQNGQPPVYPVAEMLIIFAHRPSAIADGKPTITHRFLSALLQCADIPSSSLREGECHEHHAHQAGSARPQRQG